MPYEKRLNELGVNNQSLLSEAKSFREARRELVHEKAIEPSELGKTDIRAAQKEAEKAINFIHQVQREFNVLA